MNLFANTLRALAMYIVAYGTSFIVAFIIGRLFVKRSLWESVPIMDPGTMQFID